MNHDEMGILSFSDLINVAKASGYPMDNGVHILVVKACELAGWDSVEAFRRIFNEK